MNYDFDAQQIARGATVCRDLLLRLEKLGLTLDEAPEALVLELVSLLSGADAYALLGFLSNFNSTVDPSVREALLAALTGDAKKGKHDSRSD